MSKKKGEESEGNEDPKICDECGIRQADLTLKYEGNEKDICNRCLARYEKADRLDELIEELKNA